MSEHEREKPPASASIFARAAWFMADYADVFASWCFDIRDDSDNAEGRAAHAELLDLDRRLQELDGEWEAKREAGTTLDAAKIVADMLSDWRLPGAVWYSQERKRWRVTGDGYRASAGEICCGVYAPGVDAELLREDFEAVENPPTGQHP